MAALAAIHSARLGRDERGSLGALDQDEVGDRSQRHAAPEGPVSLQSCRVVEREEQASSELRQRPRR